ncbi:MAG TPA: protein kinase [Pyrinomonadaceae bacterium]|nr:protein kinase [Pyrinomonadaceae bacterium]
MAECSACGARYSPGEHFCGNCGAQIDPSSSDLKTVVATLGDTVDEQPMTSAQLAITIEDDPQTRETGFEEEEPVIDEVDEETDQVDEEIVASAKSDSFQHSIPATGEPKPISSDSLGGSYTDNIRRESTGGTSHHRGTTGGHSPTVKQLPANTVLNNRYEIVRRIGGGGMGAVYLAKDRNLGDAPRAVKEMVESHLDPSQHEKAIGDFKRESLLLTALEHPSIPTIYDYFYDDVRSRFYLVMKYISGGDLASRMRAAIGGRLDEKTVTDWGMQIADVLDYLHSRPKPIIYRDLKPANLMIDGNNGRVMLIDFGIARWVTQQEKGVTAVGTMGYAPPELFSGRVQPASDVYSLGATMFHLLTGADPQDNPLLIFDFSKNPRPRQITPQISTEMEQILMRCVEYKPDDRYRSANDLRNELAIHLEKLMSGRVSYGMPAQALGSETVQVQTVYCGFCGGRIAADDVFCAHCGARQPLAAVGASAMLHASRPTAKLVVAGTTELDASFILQKESNLLGRTDPHSNIFPEIDLSRFDPETKVSRRHARIWLEGETYLVEDLGSVNGTVINDSVRLAPRQPRVLDSGDKLRVGETTLHFLVG